MIEILDKHKARLIVNVGSGKSRKRKTKTVTYTGKKDLERQHRDFEEEVRQGSSSSLTVAELVDSYIKNRELIGARDTTLVGYKTAEKRIYSAIGERKAESLTTYQVDEFIASMTAKYSPKTIANTVGLLHAAYDRAIKLGQLTTNPCEYATLPKKKKKEIVTFSQEELVIFLSELDRERLDYKVCYELCLFCGMRRSEAMGLREEDINLLFKQISVNKGRHRVDRHVVVTETKTERSNRVLAMPDIVVEDVRRLIEQHHALPFQHSGFLIQDGFGNPINPSSTTRRIRDITERAGLPPVTVHGLRHTYATLLNAEGVDIARISAELGHSNITTTLNTYTHVFGSASASSRAIADTVNSVLKKSATNLPQAQNKKA